MTMLSSSSPVTATTMRRRPLDAGALEHEELGRVAVDDDVLELVLEPLEAVAALLDERHLVAGAQQAAREVRADLPAACDQDVHQAVVASGIRAGADGFLEPVDRARGRADDAQALGRVELGARRVEQADDDALDPEELLHDLADDDVRVVAVGGDDHGVGVVDPGAAQHRRVHAVADDEAAVPALAEPAERLLLLVDGDDVPALVAQRVRDRGADPAAADDDRLHGISLAGELGFQDALRVGEHHDLAGRAAEHVVDGRAEEPRLAPPARRRAEHDQVGADLASPSGRSPRRSRGRGRSRPRSARRARGRAACASISDALARSSCSSISASSGSVERDADHVQREDRPAALLGELDRGREHLLADRPELDRHEDRLVLALARRARGRAAPPRRARSRPARRGLRAHDVEDGADREPDRAADPRRLVRRERRHPERR